MNDELLVKYLVGETTEQETAGVEQWIAASENNRKYYNQYKFIWEESTRLEPAGAASENEAWERFKQIRLDREKETSRVVTLKPRFPGWLRIAAGLLLLATGSLLFYIFNGNKIPGSGKLLSVHSMDKVIQDTLPDGSVVTLNKKSSLSCRERFSGNNRTVILEGEAFFHVTPDKSKPFIIHTGDIDITVVGTSFNVKSSAEKISVIVETGIVEVSRNKEVLRVNPKEMVVAVKKENKLVKEKSTDELYNYYRTKEFICNGTPLWKLVDVLNEAYGTNIVIADSKLKDLPLTTTFHDASLEDILKIIRETFDIKTENRNGQIILH